MGSDLGRVNGEFDDEVALGSRCTLFACAWLPVGLLDVDVGDVHSVHAGIQNDFDSAIAVRIDESVVEFEVGDNCPLSFELFGERAVCGENNQDVLSEAAP